MVAKELTVKKVEAVSIAKLVGALNGIIGVVIGTISAIVAIIGVVSNNDYGIMQDFLISIGILLSGIIVYPIIAYALGWVYGWLIGSVFNVVAGVSDGVSIIAEEKAVEVKK